MPGAQIAEGASRSGDVPVATGLTAVARARTARREHVLHAVPGAIVDAAPRWHPLGEEGPSYPMCSSRDAREGRLACRGQLLTVAPGTYDWICLLLAGQDRAGAHEILLHYEDAVDPEWLHAGSAGSAAGVRVARVGVPRPRPLVAVRLPEAPGLRVLALTLVSPPHRPERAGSEPVAAPAGETGYRAVDLGAHLDCVGIEPTRRPGRAAFNVWSNAFPLEELPCGSVVRIGDVPFRMPPADGARPDNLRCRGQRIELPAGRADFLHVLAAAERRSEDPLTVHYADGTTRSHWLRVSDFWPETPPRFGEAPALRTSALLYPNHVDTRMSPAIWAERVPVAVPSGATAVTLPDNPAIHVLAMTVVAEDEGSR
ncbi:MAG: hypothetical protein ACJ74O_16060 [Frankiaceae bacterium]